MLIRNGKRQTGANPSLKVQAIDLVWANALHFEEELFVTFWGSRAPLFSSALHPNLLRHDEMEPQRPQRGIRLGHQVDGCPTVPWCAESQVLTSGENLNHCKDCQGRRIHHVYLQAFKLLVLLSIWFRHFMMSMISNKDPERPVGCIACRTSANCSEIAKGKIRFKKNRTLSTSNPVVPYSVMAAIAISFWFTSYPRRLWKHN